MPPAQVIRYERLPARGRNGRLPRWGLVLAGLVLGPIVFLFRGSVQELWDGRDHLLVVDRSGFSERYRRFRYKDIQALQAWQTHDGRITAFLLALLTLGFATLAVLSMDQPLTAGIVGGVAAGMAVLFAWQISRGATFRTRLRTAVQFVELSSLGCARTLERALPVLRQRIEGAQGRVARGEILSMRSQWAAADAANATEPSLSAAGADLDGLAPPEDVRAHWAIALLCFADPLHTVVSLLIESPWLDAISILILLGMAMACVLAIRNQRRGAWPPLLRALPWLCLAIVGFAMTVITALMIVAMILFGVEAAEDLQWYAWPPTLVTGLLLTVLTLAIGLLGIIELRRLRSHLNPSDAELGGPAAPAT